MPNPSMGARIEMNRNYTDLGFSSMGKVSTTSPPTSRPQGMGKGPPMPLSNAVDTSNDTDKKALGPGTYLLGE